MRERDGARKRERERERERDYCRISGVFGRICRRFERDLVIRDMTEPSIAAHPFGEPVF